MKEKAKAKYNQLKAENPNLDKEMIATFIEEMPEEAIMLFDKMMYGCHIVDKEMYDEAVNLLKWVNDKGKGAKWSVSDIKSVANIDFDNKDYYELDFAYVMNMLWSDYCDVFTEPMYYVKMSKNYLEDPDYMGDASERAYKDAKKRIKYNKNPL